MLIRPGFSGLSFSHRFLESTSTMSVWREQMAEEVNECKCVHVCECVCVHDTCVSRYVSDGAYVHSHPPHVYIRLCVCGV